MKKTLCTCALLVFAVTSAGCSFKIFEDVGSDPHPPTVEITELVHYVEPPPEPPPELATSDRTTLSPQGRSRTWDSGGFTLSTGQLFKMGIAYTDAGSDILRLQIRDRDGATVLDIAPTDLTYFSGTSGIVLVPDDGLELTGLLGPHRLELWAEDSHLSRSEKVEFVITLVP